MDQGPTVVSIFRLALIIESQHTPRSWEAALSLLAPLTPARFRLIRTTEIARVMVAAAVRRLRESAMYTTDPEMMALVAGAAQTFR